uniref:beta-1,3-galactosyl-O-glycosyl-glycoprotein beta-1,6-N-acetylglucosaminyltransferase-like n=1 Tax=Styela clava TaxID=7725 RepID=UPI00193A1843|nr:beta-1,3-galactosyl-O-glycosyl-glycoprotein beta-1,6-N-acetylglucosaminyltransferase-like [Styela clava]
MKLDGIRIKFVLFALGCFAILGVLWENKISNGLYQLTPMKGIERNTIISDENLNSLQLERKPEMKDVDCLGIINGDKKALDKAKTTLNKIKSSNTQKERLILPDKDIVNWTANCNTFVLSRKYITSSLSQEEAEYPIAYIISIYTDLQSFEHLLQAIYRPQNIYCIHVDQKSLAKFQTGVMKIIRCFENVFLASKMVKVWYTHWTIVQSSLNCMEDLVDRKLNHPWKYVINTCGQDYPTKTNLEIVHALKNLNGSNSVESVTLEQGKGKSKRFEYSYIHPKQFEHTHDNAISTRIKKQPPPDDIEIFTGSNYYIYKREAVEFIVHDKNIRQFFEWSKDTKIPDEQVWATLQRMYPIFPGSSPKELGKKRINGIARTVLWRGPNNSHTCRGQYIRSVCVFGFADLKWVVSRPNLFANKFRPNVDIFAMNCLAEWLRNRTINTTINERSV